MELLVIIEAKFSFEQDLESNKFTLTTEIVRNELIDSEVFVFQRDLNGVDTFCAVATPIQMSEFLANVPDTGEPFFRVDKFTLEFDKLSDLIEVRETLKRDIQQLAIDTQIILDEVPTEESITFFGKP